MLKKKKKLVTWQFETLVLSGVILSLTTTQRGLMLNYEVVFEPLQLIYTSFKILVN